MEKLLKVRCGNPFFHGTIHGVKFQQEAGGAVGMATIDQAAMIIEEENFSCSDLAQPEPATTPEPEPEPEAAPEPTPEPAPKPAATKTTKRKK